VSDQTATTPAESFRALVKIGAAAGTSASDLFDAAALLHTADAANAAIRDAIRNPPPSYIPTYSHAATTKLRYQALIAGTLRAQIQRVHNKASGHLRLAQARRAEPMYDNAEHRYRLESDVERYMVGVRVLDDDALDREADELIATLRPQDYARARALAQEARRRDLAVTERRIENAVHTAKTGWGDDPEYLAAQDLKARASAWLAANSEGGDPLVSATLGGATCECRVSELLVQDAEIDAGAPPKPAKPAGGMVMHGMRKRP
jgi:hypothetical protein